MDGYLEGGRDGWIEYRANEIIRQSFSGGRIDSDGVSIRVDIEADFDAALKAEGGAPVAVASARR